MPLFPAVDAALPEEGTAAFLLHRLRVLAVVALGPLITGYAGVAAIAALVTAAASQAQFSTAGVLSAAAPSWLAVHQVPLRIGPAELGFLPLLPTIGVLVLVAKTAAGAAHRLGLDHPTQAGPIVFTAMGAHAVFGVVLATVTSAPEATASILSAAYYPALVSGLAATIGVARRCRLLDMVAARADNIALIGLRAGALGAAVLVAAGALVVVIGLIASFGTARGLFAAHAPGAGSGLGMLLLCVAYLPNAVVAGTSFLAGPGFSIGAVEIGPLDFTGGPVPAVPLLAALPEERAAWWPALLAVPLVIGAVIGWLLRDVDERPIRRLRSVAVAAMVVAMGSAVVGAAAGGRLGSGMFDPVEMRAPLLSVLMAAWILIPGGLVAWFAGERPARVVESDVDDATDDEEVVDAHDDADDTDGDSDEEDADAEDDPEDDTDAEGEEPDETEDAEEEPADDDGTDDDSVDDIETVDDESEEDEDTDEDLTGPPSKID
ncbi:hypothetical protein EV193_106161 [Herbihabitans rhizosphaerae]|uniref:Uncharacterized protein n=1 Tax=Herbihabitans rhizosphaerae TaxID=1872711 RepID=A0A4Q7KL21_9PSEU|nr:DUF6350 family protein [Herbihabitans rhizosphaerae]RZS36927.1 hypothetical protein EV193_106161 [Herbihabitans rhizosphaerae]